MTALKYPHPPPLCQRNGVYCFAYVQWVSAILSLVPIQCIGTKDSIAHTHRDVSWYVGWFRLHLIGMISIHNSVGSIQDLKTGGRWFDPWHSQFLI